MAKPTAPQMTAALYARFSSDLQKDRSIDDQFADLEKAAKRFGFKLDKRHYYCDRAQSATTLFDRPGLTRHLLGASARNEFDVVLVEATDRLSRSKADLFWLADRFEFDKVKIFTPSGEVSDMQLTFDGHTNADMVKKLAIRVKRGHDGIAREGKIAGALSFGYDAVPGRPGERTINSREAVVVRRIFTEYASGATPRQIVAGLARDKIPSPSGAPFWNHQVIVGGLRKRGLIHNELYIGRYIKNRYYNVKNPATGKRVTRKADESDLIVAQVPHLRLIDQPLWNAVHGLREARGVKKFGASGYIQRAVVSRKDHLLAELLRCERCNGMMTIIQSGRRGQRVACSSATYRKTCKHTKSYDLNGLTGLVIDNMLAQMTDPEFLKERAKAKAEEFTRQMKEDNSARHAAQKQLDRLDIQIARLVDAIENSDQPVKELMAKITEIEIERVALRERIRLLGADDNVITMHPAALQTWNKNIVEFHEKLKRDPRDPECRLALANIVDRILVYETGRREGYAIGVYARLSAITGGIELFPTKRSHQEILAAEGFTRSGSVGSVSSRPRSSRRSTGWSSR